MDSNWTTEEIERFDSSSKVMAAAFFLLSFPGIFLNVAVVALTVWPNLILMEAKWFIGSLAFADMCLGIQVSIIQVVFFILNQENITTW